MVRRDELTAGENSTLRHSTQTRDSLGLCPFATAFRLSTGLLPQSVSNNSASRMAVQILSWLQWGRDQMIAEILWVVTERLKNPGFNGAAIK